MLEHTTTVRAESVDRAIQVGLARLNITEDEASINVISQGKKGLFGFGRQDAIVEVSRHPEDVNLLDLTDQLEAQQEQIDEDEPTVEIEEVVEETFDEEGQADSVATQTVDVETASPETKEVFEESEESEPSEQTEESAIEETPQLEEASKEKPDSKEKLSREEVIEEVANYLENIIREYGASCSIEVEDKGNQLIFTIETDKSGLVIGRHGRIINSLQVLAQVLLYRHNTRRVSVVLNVGDYRDRRAYVLEQIADRAAKQVLETKQPKVLDPLPAYERKQIHHHLSKKDHIGTHSEGKDPNRYLVVTYEP